MVDQRFVGAAWLNREGVPVWTEVQIRAAFETVAVDDDSGYKLRLAEIENLIAALAAVESPAQPPATHEHFGSGGSQWCDECGESPDDPIHVQRGADTPQPDPEDLRRALERCEWQITRLAGERDYYREKYIRATPSAFSTAAGGSATPAGLTTGRSGCALSHPHSPSKRCPG